MFTTWHSFHFISFYCILFIYSALWLQVCQ